MLFVIACCLLVQKLHKNRTKMLETILQNCHILGNWISSNKCGIVDWIVLTLARSALDVKSFLWLTKCTSYAGLEHADDKTAWIKNATTTYPRLFKSSPQPLCLPTTILHPSKDFDYVCFFNTLIGTMRTLLTFLKDLLFLRFITSGQSRVMPRFPFVEIVFVCFLTFAWALLTIPVFPSRICTIPNGPGRGIVMFSHFSG